MIFPYKKSITQPGPPRHVIARRLQVGGHIVRHQGPHTLRSNAGGGQQHTAASHGLCK